jgi:predicted nucleotidyltransferase
MVYENIMTGLIDIVSSRVKAEILRILFGLSRPELHLRELVRQSGLSLGTVQQELQRLTRIGLVSSRKDGNRIYYRANSQHPLCPEIRSLVLKTDGLVGVLEQALQGDDVALAFVFGSVARGEAGPESDVDIMVVGSISLRRLTQLLSGLSEKLGREINPHAMTLDEFAERKKKGEHFLTSVLNSLKVFVKGTEHELETMGQ